MDFRSLDETSDQAILDSDDRNSIPFTGAAISVSAQIEDNLRFVLGASHRGLWGNDQIGSVNNFGGFAYFNAMYIDAEAMNDTVRFRVGRQAYSLGGIPSRHEYALFDIVDQVLVDFDAPINGAKEVAFFPPMTGG